MPLPIFALFLAAFGIGMLVEIQGTADDRFATGVATTIRTVSEIVEALAAH